MCLSTRKFRLTRFGGGSIRISVKNSYAVQFPQLLLEANAVTMLSILACAKRKLGAKIEVFHFYLNE